MNLEDRNQSGYFQHELVITAANWTTGSSKALYYKDLAGVHRLRFNFSGTLSVGAGSPNFTLVGVTFPSYYQACSCHCGVAADVSKGRVGVSNSIIIGQSGAANTSWRLSGDVELTSAPDWI